MNPCELTVSITALANAIACKLSDEQLELTAIAVALLGENLEAIAVQRALQHKQLAPCHEETGAAREE